MAEPKKRIYAATTLGLPPLKMVLVHTHKEARSAANRPAAKANETAEQLSLREKEKLIRRIIQALEEADFSE